MDCGRHRGTVPHALNRMKRRQTELDLTTTSQLWLMRPLIMSHVSKPDLNSQHNKRAVSISHKDIHSNTGL